MLKMLNQKSFLFVLWFQSVDQNSHFLTCMMKYKDAVFTSRPEIWQIRAMLLLIRPAPSQSVTLPATVLLHITVWCHTFQFMHLHWEAFKWVTKGCFYITPHFIYLQASECLHLKKVVWDSNQLAPLSQHFPSFWKAELRSSAWE